MKESKLMEAPITRKAVILVVTLACLATTRLASAQTPGQPVGSIEAGGKVMNIKYVHPYRFDIGGAEPVKISMRVGSRAAWCNKQVSVDYQVRGSVETKAIDELYTTFLDP